MPGRRDPALLRATKPQEAEGTVYVCGRKPIKHGDQVFQPGELVPGAESWLRIESRVRTGVLIRR